MDEQDGPNVRVCRFDPCHGDAMIEITVDGKVVKTVPEDENEWLEELTVEQAHRIFDKVCQREMQMSGEEVLKLYRAGKTEWIDLDNMGVWFLLPFVAE